MDHDLRPQPDRAPTPASSRTVSFAAADGADLRGDIRGPGDATPDALTVVCHPHPSYGGDRLHPVVDAVFRRASDRGGTALRFDFRRSFDDGRGERLDVIAAAERLRATETETETETTPAPLVLVGYSFGALMALAATCGRDAPDPPPAALVLIAPPLGTAATSEPPCHDGPTLVVVAEQDQFAPPAVVEPIVADWPRTAIETIAGADHFLVGRADEVAERVGEWSERYLGR